MKLRTVLLTAAAGAGTIAGLAGTATPAFAKSDTTLSGPRAVAVGHAIHLQVVVGDDAGARAAFARLQLRDARGKFSWYGPAQRLRISRGNPYQESYTFTVAAGRRGTETFRAIVTGYATTSSWNVRIR